MYIFIYTYSFIGFSYKGATFIRTLEGGEESESTIVHVDRNRVIINVKGTNFDFSSFLVRAMNYFRAMIRFLTVVNRL